MEPKHDAVPDDSHLPSDATALTHYKIYVETYRQHVDLIIRSIAIYLALVGATIGFIFPQPANPRRTVALAIFLTLVSTIAVVGSIPGFKWVKDMEQRMRQYERQLHMSQLPMNGIRAIIWMFSAVAAMILAGTALIAFGVW